jgi:hypothetical protein
MFLLGGCRPALPFKPEGIVQARKKAVVANGPKFREETP